MAMLSCRGGKILISRNNKLLMRRFISTWTVFVGGLGSATNDAMLREAFSVHGEVIEARAVVHKKSGRCRGFGFVTFPDYDSAWNSIHEMDQWQIPAVSYGGGATVCAGFHKKKKEKNDYNM
ncbi:glycine-rich RNA-binding protein 4, mitochondrial-like [Bidens hawaiensis]|uniref:glycine-rich RNA-binding protein 4, mitochondrial-like n=1 Tax=Bidens hawaiensis TaxID=980011 RepID=UPI00404AE65A